MANSWHPPTLSSLLKKNDVQLTDSGLVTQAKSEWIVPGENHLSYSSIIMLVECCREHHWSKDIVPYLDERNIDSITKSLNVDFIFPIKVNTTVYINYCVKNLWDKGYDLFFAISSGEKKNIENAMLSIVQIFIDADKLYSVQAPKPVLFSLEKLKDECSVKSKL